MKLRWTKKERLDYTKQEDSMKKIISSVIGLAIFLTTQAQVNAVEFGKNRVQYQKFKWKYYQTENFNTYFSQDGLELGKYVAQVAEAELPTIEEFVEYGLQRRANIVVYNNFDEYAAIQYRTGYRLAKHRWRYQTGEQQDDRLF